MSTCYSAYKPHSSIIKKSFKITFIIKAHKKEIKSVEIIIIIFFITKITASTKESTKFIKIKLKKTIKRTTIINKLNKISI